MKYVRLLFACAVFIIMQGAYAADSSIPQNMQNMANTPNTKIVVTPEEKAKIQQVVHDYLLEKPEIIVETLQILQRKQYEQAENAVKNTQQNATTFADALFHQSNDPINGNPNGKITIVEFFDYQCPHCIEMVPVITDIIKSNPDVRIVYKEFPIRGPISVLAAKATLAAHKQGKYNDLSHALLTANKPLTEDMIFQAAAGLGINVDQLKKDMADKNIDDQIKINTKLAQDLKLFGTPALFIAKTDVKNNQGVIRYVPGSMNKNQLQMIIDQVNKT